MSVEYAEEGDSVVEVGVRNVRIFHRAAPPLHAHCDVANLTKRSAGVRRERVKRGPGADKDLLYTYIVCFALLRLFLPIRHRQVLSHHAQ